MRERESRWARATPWPERGGSEWEDKEVRLDSTVKEGRFQGIDTKAFQEDLQSLGFTPSLAEPETGKAVGRRRARS